MNKQSQKAKKYFGFLVLAIVVTGISPQAYSQSAAVPSNEVAVKYLGSQEDMILVGVNYQNAANGKFVLSIYNTDGDVLFRNVYPSGKLDKQFKIPKDHGKLTFILSGEKERSSKSFVIYNTTRVVEDVVVKRLD